MMIKNRFFSLILVIIALLSSGFLLGSNSSGSAIGKVVSVEGTATATGSNGSARTLRSGSSVYVSDTIATDGTGKVQIKYTDGGLVNLIPSSQYRVDSYPLAGASGSYSAELVEGGLRSASGKIAKNNPDKYAIKTPVATIGVRGTLFEVNIQEGTTYFGCDGGKINVTNEGGSRTLRGNLGSNMGEFTSADSRSNLGLVTNVRPPALNLAYFSPPPGGESLDSAQSNEDESSDQEEESETDEEGEGEEEEEEEEVDELDISEDEGNPSC